MKNLIFFSFVLYTHVVLATNQIEERVDYEGKEWTLHIFKQNGAWPYFPFEDYLRANDTTFHSYIESAYKENENLFTNSLGVVIRPQIGFCTACARGYVAKWQIKGNQLYLVEIGSWMRDLKIKYPLQIPNIYPLAVFSSSWKSPVFAYWVTQKVLLAAQENRNGVMLREYSKIRELEIEHGIIKTVIDKNPLFGLSKPEILQNEKMRKMEAVIPVSDAFKPLFSKDEVNVFFDKIQRLQCGMIPEEVEAILGKPDETSIWDPKPMDENDKWFKEYRIQDISAYIEAQKRNRINICTYNMRYYLYKEQQGKLDVFKDVHVTVEFRFDHYPDKSTRSLKKVW